MLLTTLALAALLQPAPVTDPPSPALPAAVDGEHGKLPWFKGTFEELVAKAKAEQKIVFIDFWTDWCGWCKKLDKDTYSADVVVAEMKDILVFNIDAESEAGAPLAKKYSVSGFPTLLFLNADATVRDVISGYMPPEPFNKEVQRIRRDEGTVNALRRDADADKTNIDKRWALAQKLQMVGDSDGHAAAIAKIKELDPAGQSLPSRHLAFADVMARVDALWQAEKGAESPKLVEDFLANEKHGEILFQGYSVLGQIHGGLVQAGGGDAPRHEAALLAAWKKAWAHVPEKQVKGFGSQLAWMLWEKREGLSAEDKALALAIGKKLEPLAQDDANVLDTVACVHFMNGEKDKAITLAKRCVELDPKNEELKQRLAQFGG